MAYYTIQTRKPIDVLFSLALMCFTLVLTAPAVAQECKEYTLEVDVSDTNDKNLKDGEHVIGSRDTESGKLEVRVKVKGKDVSPPRLFINGKPFKEIDKSQISKKVPACMKNIEKRSEKKSELSPGSRLLNWIVPMAEAAKRCKITYTVSCAQFLDGTWFCVARACDCNGNCGWGSS